MIRYKDSSFHCAISAQLLGLKSYSKGYSDGWPQLEVLSSMFSVFALVVVENQTTFRAVFAGCPLEL